MTAAEAPPMAVQLPARPLTLDDVTELAANDDVHRYELLEGNLVVIPPANVEHASLVTRLVGWFLAGGVSPDLVLSTPGLRITERTAGRSPDLMVLRRPVAGETVWVDPVDVLLVVEVVSPGSEDTDRRIKPAEYARARVAYFWRIERDGRAATAHMFTLGTNVRGEPAYLGHRAALLDDLLSGPPPHLS